MPFLPDERSTDKLLKRFSIELMGRFPPEDLRRFGWFEFRDHDHPESLVATQLASEAFVYLSLESDGSWRRNLGVIGATIAFMASYYPGGLPTPQNLARLKQVLEVQPVSKQAVLDWFFDVYPPDSSGEARTAVV